MTDNALVIGSTGLVGSLLVNELTTKNISTIAVTRRPIKNNYNNDNDNDYVSNLKLDINFYKANNSRNRLLTFERRGPNNPDDPSNKFLKILTMGSISFNKIYGIRSS